MDPQERKELILAGAIEPIAISTKLNTKEKAYTVVNAKRTASVDRIAEHTTGRNKRKGVLTRGIVGGVVFGPVGALAGAVTASTKVNTKTTQKTVTEFEIIDTGELIFTNQRVLFVGKREILSIPHEAIIEYSFGRNLLGRTFTPQYEEMLPNESFIISGPAAAEANLFFEGIVQNLEVL